MSRCECAREAQIDKREIGSQTQVWRTLAAILIIAACGVSPVSHRLDAINRAILGQRPGYGPASISEVPNLAAIDRLIWMPGLDEGWDPQGLAVARGDLFVSAYRSDGLWMDRGPCRVFRVDPETGKETGYFDVPRALRTRRRSRLCRPRKTVRRRHPHLVRGRPRPCVWRGPAVRDLPARPRRQGRLCRFRKQRDLDR